MSAFANLYDWVKWLHLLALISWMAGIFYLPRLFVYHANAERYGEASETLKIMEHKLLKVIMTPAMIVTWITGLSLAVLGDHLGDGWLWAKLALVLAMSAFHGACGRWRKDFAADANRRGHRFYRIANEVPTLLMFIIVLMVVFQPF